MNPKFSRRAFTAAAFSAITSRRSFAFQTPERKIELHAGISHGLIKPELHGSFAEHLGSCTYGGLWVGRESKIPNINGYRKQAVEYLRTLGIPVLRWPGGCFADDYHWRDGIGPPEKRPKTVNIHWGNYTEDNSFGTHEFMGLCKLIGSEPYLAGNVGSGTPQELRNWVEYCNYSSGSTLSDERAHNGSPEPFGVKYWGVGNENWGCGGNMTPEEYAGYYRQFRSYMRPYGDTRPFLIACGPNSNDLDWSRRFMSTIRANSLPNGFAMHFYSNSKLPATKFTPEAMQDQFGSFTRMEAAINQQRALLDTYDPDRRVGLMIDEWGIWDQMQPDEQKKYGRLWQQIPVRGAIAAALGLNVFHRQADKLTMCNIAQTVNVLHAILLTEEDKCIRTPAYWAFQLMKDHRGKRSVLAKSGDDSWQDLSVSASRDDKQMVVTFVNPKHDTGAKVNCALIGGSAAGGTAQVLHHPDLNATNTFENPDAIVPGDHKVNAQGGRIEVEMPALSIVTAKIRLA